MTDKDEATTPPCPTCEALARTVMLDQTSHDRQRDPPPTQRKWKNVRRSTINKLFSERYGMDGITDGGQSFARAIEAKLKELNT
jgi:hypothetical protein